MCTPVFSTLFAIFTAIGIVGGAFASNAPSLQGLLLIVSIMFLGAITKNLSPKHVGLKAQLYLAQGNTLGIRCITS